MATSQPPRITLSVMNGTPSATNRKTIIPDRRRRMSELPEIEWYEEKKVETTEKHTGDKDTETVKNDEEYDQGYDGGFIYWSEEEDEALFNEALYSMEEVEVRTSQNLDSVELKMPQYKKAGFWKLAFDIRYRGFATEVDLLNKDRIVSQEWMDVSWHQTLQQKFRLWDSGIIGPEGRQWALQRARLQVDCSSIPDTMKYWMAKRARAWNEHRVKLVFQVFNVEGISNFSSNPRAGRPAELLNEDPIFDFRELFPIDIDSDANAQHQLALIMKDRCGDLSEKFDIAMNFVAESSTDAVGPKQSQARVNTRSESRMTGKKRKANEEDSGDGIDHGHAQKKVFSGPESIQFAYRPAPK